MFGYISYYIKGLKYNNVTRWGFLDLFDVLRLILHLSFVTIFLRIRRRTESLFFL